jgi:hypothetical protein
LQRREIQPGLFEQGRQEIPDFPPIRRSFRPVRLNQTGIWATRLLGRDQNRLDLIDVDFCHVQLHLKRR